MTHWSKRGSRSRSVGAVRLDVHRSPGFRVQWEVTRSSRRLPGESQQLIPRSEPGEAVLSGQGGGRPVGRAGAERVEGAQVRFGDFGNFWAASFPALGSPAGWGPRAGSWVTEVPAFHVLTLFHRHELIRPCEWSPETCGNVVTPALAPPAGPLYLMGSSGSPRGRRRPLQMRRLGLSAEVTDS